jgi:hypothetical protein
VAHVKRKVEELPEAPNAPAEAPGIVYTTTEHAPGLKLFRCEAYRATLSTVACAARWRKATDAYGELGDSLAKCKTCSIGACHAGRGLINYPTWYGAKICPRCRRGTTRMIHNRVCVSCRNREYELRNGKNARGNTPVELLQRPPRQLEFILEVDGVARREHAVGVDMLELLLQRSRTTKGKLAFARAPCWIPPETTNADLVEEDTPAAAPNMEANSSLAADLWEITGHRCHTCRGRVVGSPSGVYRCAECGADGKGKSQEQGSTDAPASTEPQAASRPLRETYRYRAQLLSSTAVMAATWCGMALTRFGCTVKVS